MPSPAWATAATSTPWSCPKCSAAVSIEAKADRDTGDVLADRPSVHLRFPAAASQPGIAVRVASVRVDDPPGGGGERRSDDVDFLVGAVPGSLHQYQRRTVRGEIGSLRPIDLGQRAPVGYVQHARLHSAADDSDLDAAAGAHGFQPLRGEHDGALPQAPVRPARPDSP